MPNQTQNSSKQHSSDLSRQKRGSQFKNTKTSPLLGKKECTDSITMAARPNLPRSQKFHKQKRESLHKSVQLFPVGPEGSAGLPNLPNLPFSEFASQSSTNFLSLLSLEFLDLLQVYSEIYQH